MNEQWEQQCFGCTVADFMRSIEQSITMQVAATRTVGLLQCAMSIASDAQEEIEMGMNERARQSLNRVKLLMSNVLEVERTV